MCVYGIDKLRAVGLSKIIDPATKVRRYHPFRFNTGGAIPDFHTNMDLTSHLGIHCGCSYHHDDNWPSVTDLPLTIFMGRTVYVDLREAVAKRGHVTVADSDRETKKIKGGDIVIIGSPYKLISFTTDTNTRKDQCLLINVGSVQWFRDHKVKAVGFGGGVSTENYNEDVKPFHDIPMVEDIIFLGVLKSLEELKIDIFPMSYFPFPVKGFDFSPVHVYTIEGFTGSSE